MTNPVGSPSDNVCGNMTSLTSLVVDSEDVEASPTDSNHDERLRQPLLPPNGHEDSAGRGVDDASSENRDDYVGSVASSWNNFLSSTWWMVLTLMVFVLWPSGLIWALPEFQKHTDSTFHRGIDGSPSQIAEQALERAYSIGNSNHSNNDNSSTASLLLEPSWIVVVHASPSSTIRLSNDTYTQQLALRMEDYLLYGSTPNSSNTFFRNQTKPSNLILRVSSYYSFQQQNLTLLANPFMSNDQKTTMIEVQCSILPTESTKTTNRSGSNNSSSRTDVTESEVMDRLHDYYTKILPPPKGISVSVTGLEYFSQDLRNSTKRDLTRMDILVIPCALLLVGWVLQSRHDLSYSTALGTLWIIPLCCLASTIATWSLLMNPIARAMQITQFTPSIMMSLTLGVCIDYTLFLLTRYLESMRRQQKLQRQRHHQELGIPVDNFIRWERMKRIAIHEMLVNGGQVVLVSGCTLMCTFLGLVFLPLPMLKSIGVGAAVALLSSMTMNVLWIVPALLYSPLGTNIVIGNGGSCQLPWAPSASLPEPELSGYEQAEAATTATNTTTSETISSATNNDINDQEPNQSQCRDISNGGSTPVSGHIQIQVPPKSIWVWLCKHYLLHPYKSVICILVIMQLFWLPIAKNALRVHANNISFDLLLPKKSPSIEAYHLLENEIGGGPGRMTPYRLLFVVDDGDYGKNGGKGHHTDTTASITSAAAFDVMHSVIFHLMHPTSNYSVSSEVETRLSGTGLHPQSPRDGNSSFHSGPTYASHLHSNLEWQPLYQQGAGESNSNILGYWPDNATLFKILEQPNASEPNSTASSIFSENRRQLTVQERVVADSRIAALARFTGISIWNNIPIPHAAYAAAKYCTRNERDFPCPVNSMRALNHLDRMVTSSNEKASIVTVSLSVSPFSKDGIAWLDQSRRVLAEYKQRNRLDGIDVYIDGTAAIAHDAVTAVYGNFTRVISITVLVVMILMGLFFHSIVPPLRSIVSIVCTLSFSYGLAVLVYEDGVFDDVSTHFRSIMALSATTTTISESPAELCWLVPIMSFSIMIGLALDYDVFLISRIYEFRFLHSYQHDTSIVAGLDATGGIITAAGIIMAISFGSVLAISDSPALQQWSFLLTTAVLLDTFVVRTILVPTLTGWIGPKYGWYPLSLPLGNVRWGNFDERHDVMDETAEDVLSTEDLPTSELSTTPPTS